MTLRQKMTDAEIDAAIASDPDWAAFEPIDWSKAEVVVPPKKQAISIRLDQDLVDFFKAEGPGYQRRINAVLRSYVIKRKRA
ncbi:BrnA antitoxin family protein [Methylocystis sp.]|uniref:BrnA antitoxin family protein n=1 Tax=Methylocystis sp. TaxID=1911079 RepID=UPI003D0CDD48